MIIPIISVIKFVLLLGFCMYILSEWKKITEQSDKYRKEEHERRKLEGEWKHGRNFRREGYTIVFLGNGTYEVTGENVNFKYQCSPLGNISAEQEFDKLIKLVDKIK
jgi:hypothetical protein